jgi:PAS domain S-box-containing protein
MGRKRGKSESESYGLSGVWSLPPRLLLLISGSLLCILSTRACVAQQNAKNVLFVFSAFGQQRDDLNSLEEALRDRVPQPLNFYASHIDYERMGDASYRDSLAETFRNEYKDVRLDVAVVSSIQALQFVTSYRNRILPGVPIVFYGLSARALVGLQLPPATTGRTTVIALRETIDLALRLHPDAQAVAIITESPGFWWDVAHSELGRHRDQVKEIDLFGPPANELLDRIAALPPRTIILFQLAPLSAKESDITPDDVLAAAAKHLPTYCAWKRSFILGCIGGAYGDSKQHLESTADVTARVLSGERPENIPVVDDSSFVTEVDWRELRRWHIPESFLPPGTVVSYREPTFWHRYRTYIIASLALILSQALLIAGLLRQRARKRRIEAGLRESEERFRVMSDASPSLIWMSDTHGKITYLNDRWITFTGREEQAGFGDKWIDYIHPDDAKNMVDIYSQAHKDQRPFSSECRMRNSEGVYRWMFNVASPRGNGNGAFAGLIGTAIDVTDQKLAQQALEKVSGQLIEAQEQERSRIARELHDDICQRLALLSMGIDQANMVSDQSSANMKENLREIGQLCNEIANDVQGLSHQLHSSVLDYLGLAMAIGSLCEELSRQYDITIKFTHRNVRKHLPKDISLCLFRITQEALHNAVKYSGVTKFSVDLSESADTIQLLVADQGAGFDVEEAMKKGGLGLVSMQERAHLVRGTISVESKPGEGTKILAVVPLASTKFPAEAQPDALAPS